MKAPVKNAPSSDSTPDLRRIGSVSHLNARPLIAGLEDRILLEPPAALARDLRAGRLDAALVPVAEYFEHPRYQIVPGIAIASRGAVRSVYLASRLPLARLKTVALDPSSRTSNLLLRAILAGFYGVRPDYSGDGDPASRDARLVIGDQALRLRPELERAGFELHDLGAIWRERTGLPFVFAFWAIREGLDGLPYLALFARAKEEGLRRLKRIAAEASDVLPPDAALEYLTRCVHYDLGGEEVKGLLEFQRLCARLGLIARAAIKWQFEPLAIPAFWRTE